MSLDEDLLDLRIGGRIIVPVSSKVRDNTASFFSAGPSKNFGAEFAENDVRITRATKGMKATS